MTFNFEKKEYFSWSILDNLGDLILKASEERRITREFFLCKKDIHWKVYREMLSLDSILNTDVTDYVKSAYTTLFKVAEKLKEESEKQGIDWKKVYIGS